MFPQWFVRLGRAGPTNELEKRLACRIERPLVLVWQEKPALGMMQTEVHPPGDWELQSFACQ
jgi:hypothetical protein